MPLTCERSGCTTTASVFGPDEAICKPHAVDGPFRTDKELNMNALGALLASTMEFEFDEDHCERGN